MPLLVLQWLNSTSVSYMLIQKKSKGQSEISKTVLQMKPSQ